LLIYSLISIYNTKTNFHACKLYFIHSYILPIYILYN
jgi:hypothetical protein